MDRIGLESPRSAIAHSMEEAAGGAGEGRAAGDHPPELHAWRDGRRASPTTARNIEAIVRGGLEASPTTEVLIERIGARLEGISRWRWSATRADNAIIICSIENIDPMGVHTGDSITVAPALTLTDKEYQRMRIGGDRGAARNRRRNRRFQRPVRNRSEDRADGRDRDEPARVAVVGAGVEGDRLPDRQGRGQAGGRLHARRDRQRHHRRRDPGELRADHRLCRHQDPALRLREVPRARRAR